MRFRSVPSLSAAMSWMQPVLTRGVWALRGTQMCPYKSCIQLLCVGYLVGSSACCRLGELFMYFSPAVLETEDLKKTDSLWLGLKGICYLLNFYLGEEGRGSCNTLLISLIILWSYPWYWEKYSFPPKNIVSSFNPPSSTSSSLSLVTLKNLLTETKSRAN